MLLFRGRGALLIRMRWRGLVGWCCMDGVRGLHPNATEILDSPRKLSEARLRRDGRDKERRERGENNAPEWSGWLHGMENLCPMAQT